MSKLAEDGDPECMLNSLYTRIRSILDECVPKIPPRPIAERPRNRWFDGECRALRRELRKQGKKAIQGRQSFLETKRQHKLLIRKKNNNFSFKFKQLSH